MVDVKEIKSIRPVSFTLMSSSIQAILAFIFAIILAIAFGTFAALVPQLAEVAGIIASLGVAIIIIYPISAFLINVTTAFISVILYNGLVPRVGGIKLGFEGSEIKSIPTMSFALIMACIEAIWAFIIGLLLAATLIPLTGIIGTAAPLISNSTGGILGSVEGLGTAGVLGALFLIIGLPIIVFIFGFIGHALFAIFYNYLIPRVGGIKLELAEIMRKGSEITSIPVLPASIAVAVVFTVFGFIMGLINLVSYSMAGNAVNGIVSLITTTIMYFIMYFIIVALITIFYNFLAPRIGGVKLELE